MMALLNGTIGMTQQGMRTKVTGAGFRSLDACSQFDRTYVHNACQTVRKTEGNANTKEITMEMEHRLVKLCEYSKFQYITDGSMVPADCNMQMMNQVYEWKEGLPDDPETASVNAFTESANKKVWFEEIRGYFAFKKGRTGYPLLYVIRAANDPLDPAPAWGHPTLSEYLETQGRHEGRFYAADNTAVWLFLRQKCVGTNAWNCIRSFERRCDGRGAYLALHGQYMGADVTALLLKKAETTLEHLRFDGRSKSWTWEKFVGKYREALHDLGPSNQMSEERKVVKFLSAFQVQHLSYCEGLIMSTPHLAGSLERTITFLSQQIAATRLKNGPIARNVSSIASDPTDVPTPTKTNKSKRQINALKRKLKALQERKKQDKNKFKNKRSDKFNPDSPGDYLPASEWNKITEDQKAASRAARKAMGIPVREVSSIASGPPVPGDSTSDPTVSGDQEPAKDVEVLGTKPKSVGFAATVSQAAVNPADTSVAALPATHLKPPPMKSFTISQRPKAYAKRS